MFGYVRPVMEELTEEEQQLFSSYYCGLCREMGFLGRLTLQYDCAFFALVLSGGTPGEICFMRCRSLPFRRRRRAVCPQTVFCADLNVILAYYKAKDDIRDGGSWKGRLLRMMLYSSFRRAKRRSRAAYALVDDGVKRLLALERRQCEIPDEAADTMGELLRELTFVPQQPLGQMFYHIGRWLYLVDAMADYSADEQTGAYNVLRIKYGTRAAAEEEMEFVLWHALSEIEQYAAQIQMTSAAKNIVTNVLYRAMSAATMKALSGERSQVGSIQGAGSQSQ